MDTDRISPEVIEPQPTPGTTLNGRYLLLSRLIWLLLTLLVLLTLSQIWPENYRVTYHEWIVTQTRAAFPTATTYGRFVTLVTLLESLSALTALLTGFLIFYHRSHDRIGLFTSATLILWSPFLLSSNMDVWHLPMWVPFRTSLLLLLRGSTITSIILFFYLFPNGRFYPRWTRWPALLILLLFTLFLLSNLIPIASPFGDLWQLYVAAFLLSLLIAGAAQIHRYRTQYSPIQRQQVKSVVFAITLYILTLVPTGFGLLGGPVWGPVVQILALLLTTWLIPLAIGFSILYYRLWDIDLLINRTAVYGSLTLLVTTFYILTVGLLSTLFQSANSLALSTLATGLIAILFNPVRQRLQTAVNRLMYGERHDPITVLTTLGKQLAETAVPAQTLPTLVETIAQTLKLPYVAIVGAEEQGGRGAGEQGGGGAGEILAVYPYAIRNTPTPYPPPPTPHTFPLTYQSTPIGHLLVSPRAPGEAFSPAERRLLENVARQAGTAVYAVQLTHDLQRSREQLVTAREEERRRIRRDLHDGLGPQLATLSLKVDTARNHLQHNPTATDHLLRELKSDLQTAISDIRQLVHDLRPPTLDQLGLVSALQEFAHTHSQRSGLQITLTAPPQLPPLPAAVEVAIYRIALEAITNTIRHAHATQCHVTLTCQDTCRLDVWDNGQGLPTAVSPGIGLASMRERTAELGGTFTLQHSNAGTRLTAVLPLAT